MLPTAHPSREELAAFLVGTLLEPAKEAVVTHLNSCAVCQTTLAELDEGQGGSDAKLRGAEGTNSATQASPAPSAGQPTGTATQGSQSVAVSTDAPTAAATVVLRSLGEYQLLEKMGHGGMGTVYKARHVKLKRLAAIKLLPPERMEDTNAVARFEREMEAVGRLNHPNIVQAYDAREIAGTHFLAMEFVDGLNLHEVLQRSGPLSVANACEVIRQAAVGLQCAHEHGLVHRFLPVQICWHNPSF